MSSALRPEAFVQEVLDQTEAFLFTLPEGAYEKRVEVMGASIGGHLRHSLEHLGELIRGLDSGEVHFERRERDALLAASLPRALAELQRLRERLAAESSTGRLERPLSARSSLSGRLDESLVFESSVGRELVYVGLHLTHHMALMAVSARLQGLSVPKDFGKAPATVAFERASA